MYAPIRETIIRLVELIVFTGLILHILPGEQYWKYVKLLIGIILIAFVLDVGSQFEWLPKKDGFNLTEIHNEKLNFESEIAANIEESQYSRALSTYENKIKDKINKLNLDSELNVKDVKIGICEDVDNVDYGEITTIKVELSKNVDKSANILVNDINIGNMSKKCDNLEDCVLERRIAEELGVKEEVVQVVIF